MIGRPALATGGKNCGSEITVTNTAAISSNGILYACCRDRFGPEKFQEYRPERGYPCKEDCPSRVRVGYDHILEISLRCVRVIPDKYDYDHPENIRSVGGQQAKTEHGPDSRRRPFVFRQDKSDKRGCEDAEGIDSRARGRDHDCYRANEVSRRECETWCC